MKELKNDGIYELTKKYNNFRAQATVLIGYAKNKNKIHFFEGSAEGKIVKQEIESDFGRDPIFHPDGYNISYGAMPRKLKNKISMRSIAANKLKKFLEQENMS